MAPSLCGSFLTDRRSLVAFTWTLTTVLTLAAFVVSSGVMIHLHTYYKRMERYYEEQYYEQQQQNQNNGDDGEEEQHNSGSYDEREMEQYLALASMQSGTMTFVAVYTMFVAVGLSLYGTTAIVGFTSLRGDYIGPCFSSGSSNLKLGIFGGAIIFFANLLLVCAVIFGEVRVEDWRDNKEGEEGQDNDREPYELERIATVLAVTCMFLAALYSIFAILLFLFFGNKESGLLDDEEDASPKQPTLAAIDPRRENFITMGAGSTS